MNPVSVNVVPAQPGYFVVYHLEDLNEAQIGEPVIAWRIETREDAKGGFTSACHPLTVDGDAYSNLVAIFNPDNTVTALDHSTYRNFESFVKEHFLFKRKAV